MNQLTIEEMMEIRRSIIKRPKGYGRLINLGGITAHYAPYPDVNMEEFNKLKAEHPYETDLIIGYAVDIEFKLKNYNREQWRGMMDRDPDKDGRIKYGRTKLRRSANHHYQKFDVTLYGHEEFKERVKSFGDVEWYVSSFFGTYRPDRWYIPLWGRVREVVDRW